MDTFLNTYDLPKLSQEDINYLPRSTISNEIEAVMVSQQRKAQDWTDSLLNYNMSLNMN
jgi:hypothetical protein